MARKRQMYQEYDSSAGSDSDENNELDAFSDDDPDSLAERRRLGINKRNKKRRHNGKESAIYGVFAEDEEDDNQQEISSRVSRRMRQTQSFVPATEEDHNDDDQDDIASSSDDNYDGGGVKTNKSKNDNGSDEDEDQDQDDSDDQDEYSSDSSTDQEKPKIPRNREQEEEEEEMELDQESLPRGFGARGIGQRKSFKSSSETSTPPPTTAAAKPKANLSTQERKHFANLSSSGNIGLKLLQKMGWQSGTGLGTSGQGIVTPLQAQKLPQGAGIAFGKEPSPVEKTPPLSETKKLKQQQQQRRSAEPWKKKDKPQKTKVHHRTYEELLAQSPAPVEPSLVTDISGQALPSLSHAPVPSTAQLPELRHNAALIVQQAQDEISHLSQEARNLQEKQRWLEGQQIKVKSTLNEEEIRINRLQQLKKITDQIVSLAKDPTISSGKCSVEKLEQKFTDHFQNLYGIYPDEYEAYHLDDVVIAAISPTMKRVWATWDPLEDPTANVSVFRKWKPALRMSKDPQMDDQDNYQLDIFGSSSKRNYSSKSQNQSDTMTAYENLIWALWIPRVRSAINNSWDPSNAQPIVDLYSSWSSILPRFLRDNILDQLILPKVRKSVDEWQSPHHRHHKSNTSANNASSLHGIVFPWLEHAGLERMDDLIDEAKRKIRTWLKNWRASTSGAPPVGLDMWKQVLSKQDWDNLLLKNIVPQLSAILKSEFKVYPPQQDLAPLDRVLAWKDLLSTSTVSHLLEQFVIKWIDALYLWLTQGGYPGEVAEWFKWWKEVFSSYGIEDISSIVYGQKIALNLMNESMQLGEDAKYILKKPQLDFPSTKSSKLVHKKAQEQNQKLPSEPPLAGQQDKKPSAETTSTAVEAEAEANEISFRSLVEELAAENDLLFQPTGKSHEETGNQLFRVSKSIDGKYGVTVYLSDDIVWMQQSPQEWEPVSIEEMVSHAQNAKLR